MQHAAQPLRVGNLLQALPLETLPFTCPHFPLAQTATRHVDVFAGGAINFVPRFAILMNGFFNAMFLARYAAWAWTEQEPNWPDVGSLVWLLVTAPPFSSLFSLL